MSQQIYNKNAREKALLEEAYSTVHNLTEQSGKKKGGEAVVKHWPTIRDLPGQVWRAFTGGKKGKKVAQTAPTPAPTPAPTVSAPLQITNTVPQATAPIRMPPQIKTGVTGPTRSAAAEIAKQAERLRNIEKAKNIGRGVKNTLAAPVHLLKRHPKTVTGLAAAEYARQKWNQGATQDSVRGLARGTGNVWRGAKDWFKDPLGAGMALDYGKDAINKGLENWPEWLGGKPKAEQEEGESENIFDWHGLLDQLHEELETAFDTDIPKEDVAELFATNALSTWVDNELVNENAENIFDWHGLLDQLHEELETAFDTDIPKENVAELFATNVLMSWLAT